MPGDRTKKNYKRWLSITLILFCSINPTAPMLATSGRPVIANADDGKDDDDDDQRRFRNFSSCSGGQSFEATMFALTDRNSLLNFNPGQPGVINSVRFITGLSNGENVVGIDFRPANGQLYALTTANRLYTINPSNGAATPVGAAPLTTASNGQSFGFDFNPTVDRIRVVSDADQNLRLNPNNAAVAGVDGTLAYAAGDPNAGQNPNVVGSAYTNNFAGSTSTTLYSIDSNRDALVTQGSAAGVTPAVSPNTGQLFTVGGLGVDTTDMVGFDIAPVTNAAFASLTSTGAKASNLYTINLATGAATLIGSIGGGRLIRDIAYAVRAENVYAVTAGGKLIRYNPGVPGVINSSRTISGLGSGESVVGIDYRPATGQLYALSNASRLYIINTKNGAATPVGGPLTTALNGQLFGFDFNPTVDRIRVVSDADQNLRLNPNNAAVAGVDGTIAFAATDPNAGQDPNVVGSAYTNNFLGSSTTTLYGIDSNLNALVTQGTAVGVTPAVSPNTGQLFTAGSLGAGVDPNGVVGFDISSESGAAFASFNTDGGAATQLYTINLTTGAATLIGAIGGGDIILDIAIEVRLPDVFALTPSNVLVSFNAATPGIINSGRAIRGLSSREKIVGIDYRPATGQLYALSSAGRLYLILIDSDSSRAIAIRLNRSLNPALNGTSFGFDFNPVPDRIRVVSDADQNLRLNPNDGTVASADGTLAFAAGDPNAGQNPNVVGSAYTNSFLGSRMTTLYGIDSNLNALVTQGSVGGAPVSPNTGQLFTVGPLGVAATGPVGFDIASPTNAGFASLTPQGSTRSQFYTVNLVTGAATLIGPIGGLNEPIQGIAVAGFSRVRGFDFCIQDDRDGSTMQFDSCTGDFQVTRCGRGGFLFTGKGDINRSGNLLTLRAAKIFALVNISPTSRSRSGLAVVKAGRIFKMNDNDMSDNTCGCR
jgi:3D (Asp-Asp-Asp) domain-containing protein